MHICHTKDELRTTLADLRKTGSIGLVPTMGHLHEGHMALVSQAMLATTYVVASIFVNPTQFGSDDDLQNYPRTLEDDLDKLRKAGVSVVFVPSPDIMFEEGAETFVETTYLANTLMGALRPGHFKGVATVVTKLFNLFQPNKAYFGEKDYQQLAVIRKMVRDLDISVDIVSVPTVREGDGLAMSSRNSRLSDEARCAAPIIYKSCKLGEQMARQGATAQEIASAIKDMVSAEPLATLQSVDICDAETLSPYQGQITKPAVILIAVDFDPVLLIDQYVITPAEHLASM